MTWRHLKVSSEQSGLVPCQFLSVSVFRGGIKDIKFFWRKHSDVIAKCKVMLNHTDADPLCSVKFSCLNSGTVKEKAINVCHVN